ncbi:GSCOCG00009818001-RA-CDS [Cotesia congregata]|nr:GSCOCG00009818001-RA-CDS [Cotesia congregata]
MHAAIYNYSLAVYGAISNHLIGRISSFLEDKIIKNEPLETTGPFAGYTALHIACMDRDRKLVEVLVQNYHANVNAVADDGAQPIHFACLFKCVTIIKILLKAGANVDAEIEQQLFGKYIRKKRWRNDFGDKMTLSTFSILYGHSASFVSSLIEGKANFKVKSLKNKTLLMYAIEEENGIASSLIQKVQDQEWINARDSDGYAATHYRLHPKNLENDRYFDNGRIWFDDMNSAILIRNSLDAGADVNATINDDPNTLLINLAARIHFPLTLDKLLPYHYNTSQSTALYYVLRPLKTPQTQFSIDRKSASIKLILKDLIYRRTFGLFVPEDEIILMDKVIAEDIYFREQAHTYEQNIIHGELKTKVLKYDDTRTYHVL